VTRHACRGRHITGSRMPDRIALDALARLRAHQTTMRPEPGLGKPPRPERAAIPAAPDRGFDKSIGRSATRCAPVARRARPGRPGSTFRPRSARLRRCACSPANHRTHGIPACSSCTCDLPQQATTSTEFRSQSTDRRRRSPLRKTVVLRGSTNEDRFGGTERFSEQSSPCKCVGGDGH